MAAYVRRRRTHARTHVMEIMRICAPTRPRRRSRAAAKFESDCLSLFAYKTCNILLLTQQTQPRRDTITQTRACESRLHPSTTRVKRQRCAKPIETYLLVRCRLVVDAAQRQTFAPLFLRPVRRERATHWMWCGGWLLLRLLLLLLRRRHPVYICSRRVTAMRRRVFGTSNDEMGWGDARAKIAAEVYC